MWLARISLWECQRFAANAASFLPVIVTLLLVRPLRSTGARAGERLSIGGGIEHVRRRPALLALLGITAATTFFIFPSMVVLMPFYARQGLGLDAWAVGALMTATGAGAFVGAMSLLHVQRDRRVHRIAASFATAALGLILLWLALWLPLPDVRTLPGRLALALSGSALLALSVSSAMGLLGPAAGYSACGLWLHVRMQRHPVHVLG